LTFWSIADLKFLDDEVNFMQMHSSVPNCGYIFLRRSKTTTATDVNGFKPLSGDEVLF
jgi:hypothetical protein